MTTNEYPSWASLVGNRPTLEWIAVDKMVIDPTYQREAGGRRSRRHVDQIAREFTWARFTPMKLAPRGDGTYAIIDGQHSREAAVIVGLEELPCMVVNVAGVEQEADAFVKVNKDRLGVTPYQIFWSQVVAGDPAAANVKRICDEAGVQIARYPVPAKDMKPDVTLALGTIQNGAKRYGEKHLVDALTMLREAFPEKGGQLRAGAISGLALLFSKMGEQELDWKRLKGILADHDTDVLESAARAYRDHFGGKPDASIAMALVKLYNKGLGEKRQIKLS